MRQRRLGNRSDDGPTSQASEVSPWILRNAALGIMLAVSATSCDDDAALKSTARSSTCDRAGRVRAETPTLADDAIPDRLRRLVDQLDRMVKDAETSDLADLEAVARKAERAGRDLRSTDVPDSFAAKRSELMAALDEVHRLCDA